MRRRALLVAVICCGLALVCQAACAADSSGLQVSVSTSALIGHPAGPFSLAVALTNGDGLASGSSTVKLSNFKFGGGKPLADSVTVGGANGSLETSVTLTTTSFLGLFVESFAAGTRLEFTLSLSAKGGQSVRDRVTIYILDASGTPIGTLAPSGDFLIGIDLTSEDPAPQVFGSDTSRSPFVGNPISIPPPSPGESEGDEKDREHRDRDHPQDDWKWSTVLSKSEECRVSGTAIALHREAPKMDCLYPVPS